MAKGKTKFGKKFYNSYAKATLQNDLAPTYPVGGKFLKVGDSELLLVKTARKDEYDRPIYMGTVVKRHGLLKRKVRKASHILVKPM